MIPKSLVGIMVVITFFSIGSHRSLGISYRRQIQDRVLQKNDFVTFFKMVANTQRFTVVTLIIVKNS